ncbi:putative alpha-parvin isoform 2 [Scophthalmus maximus]|uniref:Putative alpha-parvin isoform 2 n=1 Tax=Scophthalmus maximus TaxID=52904 RepID=A0A2U9C0Y0_SCOMX|nr:putative alpha-parvin isoform 2 [Scophthalmus maximus]
MVRPLASLSELQEEGINAINLPLSPSHYELDPEDTMLEENEVRTMVDPNSKNDRKLQELMKVLIDWINDVLVGERIIVKDLAEDLYDGQVLQKLFEKLEGEKLNVAEVTQSEIAQKQKLQTVLERINDSLKLSTRNIRWNVDSVHAKSIVAILHLLVALSQHFRAPIRLPDHVSIQVVVVQVEKRGNPSVQTNSRGNHRQHRGLLWQTRARRLRHPVRPRSGQTQRGQKDIDHIREQTPEQAQPRGVRVGHTVCRRGLPGVADGAAGGILCAALQLLPHSREF